MRCFLSVCALLAMAMAVPNPESDSFSWAVDEPDYGNNYGHAEESDGIVTQGEYRVLLPDGRTQIVTYRVEGDSGYQAQVTFSWAVDEPDYGNNYGHAEESDGIVTQGEYRVLLPDGRTQIVTYRVEGDSGYQAQVTSSYGY
ncbi:uncharacterized protein LOC119100254 [Pollicipes pollicipes]|uniref:uncharacterized protein LOC119100254 n=1 Tax=Pollicipes pollicipes TaxID=41117 RepID=UPI001884C0F5|nr:uncharacterized protein LOC119100254 [Pollicipes pollicipes]